MEQTDREKTENERTEKMKSFKAWQFAWELGYTIAIPIVLLALGGRFLDKSFNSSPLFILLGVVTSIFISSWLIYKKTKEIL